MFKPKHLPEFLIISCSNFASFNDYFLRKFLILLKTISGLVRKKAPQLTKQIYLSSFENFRFCTAYFDHHIP